MPHPQMLTLGTMIRGRRSPHARLSIIVTENGFVGRRVADCMVDSMKGLLSDPCSYPTGDVNVQVRMCRQQLFTIDYGNSSWSVQLGKEVVRRAKEAAPQVFVVNVETYSWEAGDGWRSEHQHVKHQQEKSLPASILVSNI